MRPMPLVLALALGACASPDVFEVAQRSLLAQDLPRALVAFDAVPVTDARYPEARATALSVERRMRRGHELLLEALLLRAEWRDRDALVALRRAQLVWPKMPGVEALITATEHRASLLGDVREPERAPALLVEPVAVEDAEEEGGEALAVVPPAEAASAELVESLPAIEVTSVPTDSMPPMMDEDPVALGLVAVETKLGRGELETAVVDLIELAERFPDEVRVGRRLARVLHQRALQRYGRGHLAAAIADWERVAVLDPDNATARLMLAAARAEAAGAAPVR